jgi:hypothetical protein
VVRAQREDKAQAGISGRLRDQSEGEWPRLNPSIDQMEALAGSHKAAGSPPSIAKRDNPKKNSSLKGCW